MNNGDTQVALYAVTFYCLDNVVVGDCHPNNGNATLRWHDDDATLCWTDNSEADTWLLPLAGQGPVPPSDATNILY